MASVSIFNPFIDFSSNPSSHWSITAVTQDRIVYEATGQRMIVQGSFTLGPAGEAAGGTVTGIQLNVGASTDMPAFGIANFSIDAKAFVQLMAEATGDQQVYSFLLAGDDAIAGTQSRDVLQGFGGNDRINAGAGDDWIVAGAGSDSIDGGAGFDVVEYSGKLSDYKVERLPSGYRVTHLTGDGGTDTLVNVERAWFSDKHVALVEVDGTGGQLVRLYQAAFDRLPDEPGLDYWTHQVESSATTLEGIANGFILSQEYRQLYGSNASNHDLVAKYYEHILHRTPDQAGLDYWTGILDTHQATQAQVLAFISESQENIALSVTLIGNGIVMDPVIMTT